MRRKQNWVTTSTDTGDKSSWNLEESSTSEDERDKWMFLEDEVWAGYWDI